VGHVQDADVPTARPPQINYIQLMWGEHAYRVRTHQEPVGVEVQRRLIV
jgi:hypothetical protein